jgi:hypothetical protein
MSECPAIRRLVPSWSIGEKKFPGKEKSSYIFCVLLDKPSLYVLKRQKI